ncbi:MAG TPA: alanine--glyoxylate aminotransferase family protein, partial [candidate division WOR-3 bacterium]|nr:alanine--glyoxylate aminotransferase family protein [candidate division WOR-3 bacterium]
MSSKSKVRPKYRLFTPGPVNVPDSILQLMSSELVYHREESFSKLYASVQKGLQKMMVTGNEVYVLTSSGTGAMEAAVANLVLPNEKALVATVGRFGERWRELCIRFGAYIDVLSRPYGESVPPVEVERHLRSTDTIKCVFTTLTETSTGALNDIKAIGEICRRLNRYLVVDAIAGLGADELRMDDWHVDCVVGGSQKAVGVPPGLAFISLSERAWELAGR